MDFRAYVRSRQALRGVSLAVLMSFGLALAMPAISHADAESSSFAQTFRKKRFGDNVSVTSNADSAAHTKGSGLSATTETMVVNDGSVSPFLTPDSPAAMQALADKYQQVVSAGGWAKVPSGKQKKGDTGKGPAALNQRLFAEGYLRAEAAQGEFAQVFTSATEDALIRFQRNHGLAVAGTIDGPTLGALNVPADRRLATIRANIPRFAEYSKDLGPRYVVVNVPAQQIETISDGKVFSIHNAIVGRPSRPTPVVSTPLKTVRFNPYWNAPPSIVEKDLVPRMMSSGASKVMRDMNMKIFDGVGGPEVNPDRINWRRVVVDKYHFRQEPGGSNAMATAKIEFNSPFGIYLHDTPEPQLFKTAQRFYSSGCVRVEKVAILINWILQGQDGIDASRIVTLAETKERLDTEIANPPQLRVAYLTAWPAKDGVAAFRGDVYELDGTGFIVGQPLPVGETQGGQRFVLKPIPRSPDAVDADEAFGFASLFRSNSRNDDKADAATIARNGAASDSLITAKTGKAKAKDKAQAKSKTQTAAAGKRQGFGKRDGADADVVVALDDSNAPAKSGSGKKAAKKKLDDKSRTAKADPKKKPDDKTKAAAADGRKKTDTAQADSKARKVLKKDQTEVTAKKADGKTVVAKKKALSEATKTAAADPKADTAKAAAKPGDAKVAAKAKPADAKVADKKPDAKACKAGSDAKMPAGCKPAAAKKVPPKPEKTAAATN